jgi:hypothetical protein
MSSEMEEKMMKGEGGWERKGTMRRRRRTGKVEERDEEEDGGGWQDDAESERTVSPAT